MALEQADSLGAKAIYFRFFSDNTRPPRPQVYIYDLPELNSDQNKDAEIHHRLWNAGVVPYCYAVFLNPNLNKIRKIKRLVLLYDFNTCLTFKNNDDTKIILFIFTL